MRFKLLNYREYKINNYIQNGTIELCPDFTDNNLHFYYKGYEITSPLNVPHQYFNLGNPDGLLNQVEGEYCGPHIFCEEDYFRKIVIYMDIYNIVSYDDEEDEEDTYFDDEDDEEESDTYFDRLKSLYPGIYLTDEQEKGYDHSEAKRDLIDKITSDDNSDMSNNDTLFGFCYIRALTLYDDRVEFMAPSLSLDRNEWMFWATNVVDKILDYQRSIDDEEDEEDEDE